MGGESNIATQDSQVDEDATWETTDMSTAAFMMIRGGDHRVTLLKVDKDEGTGHFTYVFRDPQGKCDLLQVDFMNGEFSNYDSAIRKLKKLCFDGQRKSGHGRRRGRRNK